MAKKQEQTGSTEANPFFGGGELSKLWGDVESALTGKPTRGPDAKGPSQPKPKAKAKSKSSGSSAETTAQEQQLVANNDFAQMMKGLVADQTNLEKPLAALTSGAAVPQAQSNAVAQALSAAGLPAGGPAAQWLQANMAQGNANDAPMAAAMNQYQQAFNTGQGGVNQALTNMGQASNLAMATAPEQTWLQELAAHIQSNMNYYGTIPSQFVGTGPNALPAGLQEILKTTGTGQATGTTNLSNINVPGQPKTTGTALPQVGAVPGVTPTSGNPNTPGA